MNTKQVEELTGMSRQNIRYYERQGLLEPAREDGNAYRDYSGEDVRRLKLIKMLRMLDMPLKEIEDVINGTVSIQEAAGRQREELEQRQRQLQAAISVCGSLQKEKGGKVDVDGYLDKMEKISGAGGGFARFMDDYKQVVLEEREGMFSFYADGPVNTSAMFERELRRYASEQGARFRMIKKGRYPQFLMGTDTYTAVRVVEKNIQSTGLGDRAKVVNLDFAAYLRTCRERFDIAFLDPPYRTGLLERALPLVAEHIAPGGVILCEHPKDEPLPEEAGPFRKHKSYRYGKIMLTAYRQPVEEEEDGEA